MEDTRPSHYVKFKGNFRDLKPMGWRFWKAFARNYKVYTLRPDGSEWGQSLEIWQHCGGYLEIDQCLEFSWLIVDAVRRGEHKKWKLTSLEMMTVLPARVFINKKEERLFVYHDGVPYSSCPNAGMVSGSPSEEVYKEYHDTWREVGFLDEVLAALEFLLEKDMIEVVKDERKC